MQELHLDEEDECAYDCFKYGQGCWKEAAAYYEDEFSQGSDNDLPEVGVIWQTYKEKTIAL